MVNLVHVANELQYLVGVAPLVIVPAHQLYKAGVEHDTGLLVEDGGAGIADEVAGNQSLIGVARECPSSCLRWPP